MFELHEVADPRNVTYSCPMFLLHSSCGEGDVTSVLLLLWGSRSDTEDIVMPLKSMCSLQGCTY